MDKQQIARNIVKKLVYSFFKNDYDEPFELTDGQADIFLIIFLRRFPRNALLTYTQYGKTDIVSMALIIRSQVYKEMWTIVAGKESKGLLIMNKVMQHVFDHQRFSDQLELDPGMPLERLKRERSKEKITWLGGGGIRVLSAQTGNKNVIKEALIGEGGQNIIEEEAPHIPDDTHAMVMRMLMGHKDNFLLKIGNAFNRNHYFKSIHSDKYYTLIIDFKQGITEGRITQEMIDEVRSLPFFTELYECKFPNADELLEGGYRRLISDELLEAAFITEEQFVNEYCTKEIRDEDGNSIQRVPEGYARLGADFAGSGSDTTTYVIRWDKVMKLIEKNKISDTMQHVVSVENHLETYHVEARDAGIDYGNLGQGVGDRLHEKEIMVNCVLFGSSAPLEEKGKFKNMRAYMYYKFYEWIKNGGKIVRHDSFLELLSVNYKEDSEHKFQIQSKEELKKKMKVMGIEGTSPDTADAGALTFADNSDVLGEEDYEFI